MASMKIKVMNRLGWCVRNLAQLTDGATDEERAQVTKVIASVEGLIRQADVQMGGPRMFAPEPGQQDDGPTF